MSCKHKDVIRITNGKEEYFCKAFGKEIPEYKCRDCIMKIEDFEKSKEVKDLFNQIFRRGVWKVGNLQYQ